MKIVVNRCWGGFSVSPTCLDRYYELQNKKVYHFKENYTTDIHNRKYVPIENEDNDSFVISFSVPNPNDFDNEELWDKYYINNRPEDRTDKLLIQAIEEIGEEKASGSLARLKILEIPDDVDYEIDDYDGMESVHEKHRSW